MAEECMTDKPLLIYGAGGFAREVAWLAEVCQRHGTGVEPVGFIDDAVAMDGTGIPVLNGLPVLSLIQACARFPNASFVVAIGNPKTREAVSSKALARGLRMTSLVHPGVDLSRFVQISAGVVICAGSVITVNSKLGLGVNVHIGCTISHDTVIGEYVTLAPGARISGAVHLGRRVYIGTGAVVINGTSDRPLVIGDDAIIGAGACVITSIAAGVTAVGVPARPILKRTEKVVAHGA